jgi:hypothetical protein
LKSTVTTDTQAAPVVVLTYAHSGAESLQRLLADSGTFACTAGTGLLPLCDQAAAAWRKAERRPGPLSTLAITSIRAMTDAVITIILAENGKSRWCETALAPPNCARTFLQVYPHAQFLCLHRHCKSVVDAAVAANPWGLADNAFKPFAMAHPTSSIAAISAYWAAVTEPLLDFEAAYSASCQRVLFEDLISRPDETAVQLYAFLGIDGCQQTAASMFEAPSVPRTPGESRHVPIDQLSTTLLAEVSRLLVRVGYPRIS